VKAVGFEKGEVVGLIDAAQMVDDHVALARRAEPRDRRVRPRS
jgi:hypothetical protein